MMVIKKRIRCDVYIGIIFVINKIMILIRWFQTRIWKVRLIDPGVERNNFFNFRNARDNPS